MSFLSILVSNNLSSPACNCHFIMPQMLRKLPIPREEVDLSVLEQLWSNKMGVSEQVQSTKRRLLELCKLFLEQPFQVKHDRQSKLFPVKISGVYACVCAYVHVIIIKHHILQRNNLEKTRDRQCLSLVFMTAR